MRQYWSLLFAVTCFPSGCTLYNAPTAVAAPVFAATAVAATGARKAAVGGCWANCSKGWHCDEKSGVCKRDAERPKSVTVPRAPNQPDEVKRECRPPLRCDSEAAAGDAESSSEEGDTREQDSEPEAPAAERTE